MEFQIDSDDCKKVQLKSVSDELVVILIQKESELVISNGMFKVLKKYSNDLSNALLQICLKQETVNCNVDLRRNL